MYDGTDTATLTGTLNGVISADIPNVSLVQAATFSQANVGTGLAVTAADVLLGSVASNYTLTQPTGLTANITPKALTVTGTTVSNKVYDGTTTATLTGTLSGVVSIDAANVTLVPAGTFSQSNVGTGLAVTAADTLVGGAAGNYTLTQPTGLTASITPKALTVSGSVVNDKVYDGMTAATLSSGSLVGVVSGDNVSLNQAGTFS